jgi:hypothetical protein
MVLNPSGVKFVEVVFPTPIELLLFSLGSDYILPVFVANSKVSKPQFRSVYSLRWCALLLPVFSVLRASA